MRHLLLFFACASAALSAAAGQPTAAATKIDGTATVARLRAILAENYVLPDMRGKLDAVLARGLADGRYAANDPAVLAERLNADLSAVAHDKHLGIQFAPDRAAELAALPAGNQSDDGPVPPEEVAEAKRFNQGIVAERLLPGNIRYIKRSASCGPASRPQKSMIRPWHFCRAVTRRSSTCARTAAAAPRPCAT